jgi:hypothetical protein
MRSFRSRPVGWRQDTQRHYLAAKYGSAGEYSSRKWKDVIKGGYADKKVPQDFDPMQLKKGIKVEMEHTNNRKIAMEIAMDHLTEFPNYYVELEKMEKRLEKQKMGGKRYRADETSAEDVLKAVEASREEAMKGLREKRDRKRDEYNTLMRIEDDIEKKEGELKNVEGDLRRWKEAGELFGKKKPEYVEVEGKLVEKPKESGVREGYLTRRAGEIRQEIEGLKEQKEREELELRFEVD